jgi:hypothetical protein
MTSADPERVEQSLELLAKPDLPLGADWSALWAVADRLSRLEGASDAQRARGRKAAEAVDALAQECAAAVDKALGKKGKLDQLAPGASSAWIGESIRLLEELDGVPAREAFAKQHAKELASQRKTAEDALANWWKDKESKPADALEAGQELLAGGFLDARLPEVLEQCRKWLASDAVELKPKEEKAFLELASAYDEGRKEGFEAFVKRGAKVDLDR